MDTLTAREYLVLNDRHFGYSILGDIYELTSSGLHGYI